MSASCTASSWLRTDLSNTVKYRERQEMEFTVIETAKQPILPPSGQSLENEIHAHDVEETMQDEKIGRPARACIDYRKCFS
jgi:hypothetical protein